MLWHVSQDLVDGKFDVIPLFFTPPPNFPPPCFVVPCTCYKVPLRSESSGWSCGSLAWLRAPVCEIGFPCYCGQGHRPALKKKKKDSVSFCSLFEKKKCKWYSWPQAGWCEMYGGGTVSGGLEPSWLIVLALVLEQGNVLLSAASVNNDLDSVLYHVVCGSLISMRLSPMLRLNLESTSLSVNTVTGATTDYYATQRN